MNPNSFFFKLSAIFIQYILLILIATPLIYLTFLLKSNFDFKNILFVRILFFSIALALPIVMINAFAFANFNNFDLKYYLKSSQKIKFEVRNEKLCNLNEVKNKLIVLKWKVKSEAKDVIVFIKKNTLINDIVSYRIIKVKDSISEIEIVSNPAIKILFIDFARNYRNILTALNASKNN